MSTKHNAKIENSTHGHANIPQLFSDSPGFRARLRVPCDYNYLLFYTKTIFNHKWKNTCSSSPFLEQMTSDVTYSSA